jgi:hypothetical protein
MARSAANAQPARFRKRRPPAAKIPTRMALGLSAETHGIGHWLLRHVAHCGQIRSTLENVVQIYLNAACRDN